MKGLWLDQRPLWRIPLLVILVGSGLSLWSYQATEATLNESGLNRVVDLDVADVKSSLEHHIQANLSHCAAVTALFLASEDVNRREFTVFTRHVMASTGRSLQALEWIPRIAAADRKAYENAVRAEGFQAFVINEKNESGQRVPAAERAEYFPVNYIEPWQGNEQAFGFDLASNPQRLRALQQARDTARMMATAPIRLVQERAGQKGFLVFAPIFGSAGIPVDVETRRAKLIGFALGVYRAGDLLNMALARTAAVSGYAIQVFDVSEGQREIIHSFERDGKPLASAYRRVETLNIAGREWQISLEPTESYLASKRSNLPATRLLVGLALTLALAVISWVQQRRHLEIRQHQTDMARIVAEQKLLIGQLNEAQNHLLQSEKMASIGQLAAGVAHEINNPIGFISTNLQELKSYLAKLLATVDAYREFGRKLPPDDQAAILAMHATNDVEYISADTPALLKECEDGLLRVRNIVQDLKDFSHPGAEGWKWSNLEKCLDSTINVAWNEIKYKAEVIRDYGQIPEIECMPGQLNQVFLNLLVNAAQAIDDRGTITVRTRRADDHAVIEIADTGHGIDKAHLQRIFDPFFTTKPVGKGTGLGLSLSYSIIQKHGGSIRVHSEIGQGTSFLIELPTSREHAGTSPSPA